MDEYLKQEQDDAFFQAMRELGDSIRDKIKGKTFMVNPAAMKKAAAIMGYFKKLKKEDDEGEKNYNFTIKFMVDPLPLGSWDATVIVSADYFGLSDDEYFEFFKLLKDNCNIFGINPSNEEGRITMDFYIKDYIVQYKGDQ